MNDTIPPLAQKLVDFLRGIDTRYAAHEYLLTQSGGVALSSNPKASNP